MRLVLPPPDSGVTVAVGPLELLPIGFAPPDSQGEAFATELGWPAWASSWEEDGVHCLRVVYGFLDHGAVAEARGDRPEPLRALLARARPDWSGELAALCQLF